MKKSTKVALYGLLISILYIIFSLYMFKDKIIAKSEQGTDFKKIVQGTSKTVEKNSTIKKSSIVEKNSTNSSTFVIKKDDSKLLTDKKLKKYSNLKYEIDKDIVRIGGNLPILNSDDSLKKAMMSRCSLFFCQRDIIFSENRFEPKWRGIATAIITLFNEENITDAYLSIEKNRIDISVGFKNLLSKDRLTAILEPQMQKMDINNSSYIKQIVKSSEVNVTEDNISDSIPPKDDDKNIELIQKQISDIINNQGINFYRNRARIRKKGIETLDKIIAILKEFPTIKIKVKGYTDASGKKRINRWISHERAKSVKNYLGSRGIPPINITAEGFGEEGLLYKDNPYSKLNRRVEIEIRR